MLASIRALKGVRTLIQIDDSGSGCPVGSVGIGVLRLETKEYHFELIPLQYFQGANGVTKQYLDQVIPIVKRAFELFKVIKSEEIEICRGDIFTNLKLWLSESGYIWNETKIEGTLQSYVENSFGEYLVSLGVPKSLINTSDDYKSLNKSLERWVGRSFRDRASLCKQWGKGWQKICDRYAVSTVE